MDWIIAIAMGSCLVFGTAIVIAGPPLRHFLEVHSAFMNAVAAAMCVLLIAWMLTGGRESVLWAWMPPFCPYPKACWVRWLVIAGIVIGTLVAIIKSNEGINHR